MWAVAEHARVAAAAVWEAADGQRAAERARAAAERARAAAERARAAADSWAASAEWARKAVGR